jgi:hypothetical protein
MASRLARGFKAFLATALTGLNRDVGDQLDSTIERRLHMGQKHSSLSSARTARAGFVTVSRERLSSGLSLLNRYSIPARQA